MEYIRHQPLTGNEERLMAELQRYPASPQIRGYAEGGEVKPYGVDEERQAVSVPQAGPSISSLKAAFDRAIARHTALPAGGRNSPRALSGKDAAQRVAAHIGTQSAGQPKRLLAQNMKLQKASRGYNLDDQDTITMPDGRGIETTGLSLSPAYREGKFNTCPNSQSCAKECLGLTSGGNFLFGGGSDWEAMKGPRLAHYRNTQAFLRDPEAFAIRLHDEIDAAKKKAAENGNHLGVRLNVLSDIHPKVYESLMRAHPDVSFYDYTKNNSSPVAPNHHLTYSSTGVSQPKGLNGNEEDVHNPHQNWQRVRGQMDRGRNVAMAFSSKSALPTQVLDHETGKSYRVVDGDTHDFRPLDTQPEGADGVIIGLRKKSSKVTEANAAKESNGFFTHFDPQYERKGNAKGPFVKDANGERIQKNFIVHIAPQPRAQQTTNNDGSKE